jgi:hypothetical protein
MRALRRLAGRIDTPRRQRSGLPNRTRIDSAMQAGYLDGYANNAAPLTRITKFGSAVIF